MSEPAIGKAAIAPNRSVSNLSRLWGFASPFLAHDGYTSLNSGEIYKNLRGATNFGCHLGDLWCLTAPNFQAGYSIRGQQSRDGRDQQAVSR